MRKSKLFATLLGLLFCGQMATAQDLVFEMTEESGVEIVNNSCRFDPINKCIGNTDGGTTVCLGDVDFADGNKYAGVGIVQAQEVAGMEGYVDIYLGDPDNGGQLINDMQLKGTSAWQLYKTYRYNFYPEGSDVIRPTGTGKVYLRMRNGEEGEKYYCNVKRVYFYTQELTEEEQGLMPDPVFGYAEYNIAKATITNPDGADAHLNDAGALGWTEEGVVAKFADVDFDAAQYGQVGFVMAHAGTQVKTRINVYVDDPSSEDNLIASVWTGRDIGWSNFITVADDMAKTVTGKHDVYAVWTSPADVKALRLIEGRPLEVEYGLKYVKDEEGKKEDKEKVKLTGQAYIMTFDDMGGVENAAEIVAKGSDRVQFQSDNIGYTSYGVVVKLKDVDFKDGEFKRIVVESSTDQASLKNCFFDFYLDIPADKDFSDLSFLADETKIASVAIPATGDWGTRELTAGAMTAEVKGVHDLYIMWNTTNGSNVSRVILDVDPTLGVSSVEAAGATIVGGQGSIAIDSAAGAIVYNVAGHKVASVNGSQTVAVPAGVYVVKAGATTKKVIVK